jgi:hypothetical protein
MLTTTTKAAGLVVTMFATTLAATLATTRATMLAMMLPSRSLARNGRAG